MLKITPYLGILVLIVSIAGLWFPILGYFLLLVFASLLIISPFRGRWFCGNLCPRGSFNDFWLGKITLKKRIPKLMSSMILRVPVFVLLMGFMMFRIIMVFGSDSLVDKIGMIFVTMCIITTAISIVLGIMIAPRSWCTFCPMGTVQKWFGGKRYQLKVDKSKCVNCGICHKVCPMQLRVNEILHKPDCIKCGRCIEACPKKALSF